MAQKTKVAMAGVAEGKELIGIPTDDSYSSEDRVKALLMGSMSEDIYQVCILMFYWFFKVLLLQYAHYVAFCMMYFSILQIISSRYPSFNHVRSLPPRSEYQMRYPDSLATICFPNPCLLLI